MDTLLHLLYKSYKVIIPEVIWFQAYSIIGFVFPKSHPLYWWTFNTLYMYGIYCLKYATHASENILGGLRSDIQTTSLFQLLAHLMYPYLKHYDYYECWWLLHIIHLYFMEDLFYILIHQNSPYHLLTINLIRREFPLKDIFWDMMKIAIGIDEKVETNEEIQETETETEKTTVPPGKEREKIQKELKQSLAEESQKLKQWKEQFDAWSSSKAKEMTNLVSEESRAEEQMTSYSRQRERVKEEIARQEIEYEDLTKKFVELEKKKQELAKKRHMIETQTDKRLLEQQTEKANILNRIQTIEFELSLVQDDKETINECDTEKTELIEKRTQQMATEIEEKERDLECPVCFDICSQPIYMCHLSHQICKHCWPKVKVCPQCRQPYRKHRQRHRVKEKTSNELKILYKNMEELLEKG